MARERAAGVIFDLDGVLVDSEPYWQEGFAQIANQFCVERGFPDPGLSAEQMSRFQGGRVNDTVATILSELGHRDLADAATVKALTDRVVDHVSRRFAESSNEVASSVRVARQLADRGVALGVASSSAQKFIDTALAAIGLSDVFSVSQSALELQDGKPHPEVYLLTLDRMGLEAHEVVAIEDSTTGLGSALRAGIATIWLQRDPAESEAASRARLHATLGDHVAAEDHLRRITHDLTLDDVEKVLGDL